MRSKENAPLVGGQAGQHETLKLQHLISSPPQPVNVIAANIPDELKGRRQWVNWRYRLKEGDKWTKPPVVPSTLRPAAPNNPDDWDTHENAVRNYERNKSFAGIGFVFTKEDHYCGIDLDHCRNRETGKITPFAQEIVKKLNSYTEVSASGTGFHIICRAKLPGTGRKDKELGIEVYDRFQYFAMTGNILDGKNQIHERQAEVDKILASYFNKTGQTVAPPVNTGPEQRAGVECSQISQEGEHDAFIESLNISPDKKLAILEGRPDGERSEALMGVVVALVHTEVSEQTIFQIFENYPIGEKYREKGAARHTWLNAHIQKAKDFLKKACKPPKTFTAAELETDEVSHPDWIIENLLAPGLTLLAAPPKTGKTRLVTGIAVGLSSGGKILGSIEAGKCEVLIMCLEDAKWRIKERLEGILGEAPFPPGLHLSTEWPTVADGGLLHLEQWLRARPQVKLVIIDVLRRFDKSTARNNLYQAEYDSVAKIKAVADNLGIAIILIHHTNKLRDTPDVFDKVSGTTGLTGACDTIAVLERYNRAGMDGKLHIAGRDVEACVLALKFDSERGTWTLIGDADKYGTTKKQHEVLQYFASTDGPRGIAEIAEALCWKNNSTLRGLLSKMVKTGLLAQPERGQYTMPPPT